MNFFKFFCRYIFNHPVYLLIYCSCYALPGFGQKINFYEKNQINRLLSDGKSIIRLGDGEVYILLDTAMEFHSANTALKKELKKIVKNYHSSSNYVLALPEQIQNSNSALKKDGVKNTWLPFKVIYYLTFPKKVKYVDAHMFYPFYDKTTFANEVMPFLKKKNLVFITKERTINNIKKSNIFLNEATYVITPEHDAYGCYNEIKSEIDIACEKFGDKSEVVLLFALGPVGKVMAYYYTKQNYQSIDIGKGFDFLFS